MTNNEKTLLTFKTTDMLHVAEQISFAEAKKTTIYFINDAIIEGKTVKYGLETKTIYRYLSKNEAQKLDKDLCFCIKSEDLISFFSNTENAFSVSIRHKAQNTYMTLENEFDEVLRKTPMVLVNDPYEISEAYDIMYGENKTVARSLMFNYSVKQRIIDTMKLAPKASRADLASEAEIVYCPSTGFLMWTNNHVCVTSQKKEHESGKDIFSGYLYVIPARCLEYILSHEASVINFTRETVASIKCLYTVGDGWFEFGKFYEDARQTNYAKCFTEWDKTQTNKLTLDSKSKEKFLSFLKCVKETYTKGSNAIKPIHFSIGNSLKVRGGQSKTIEDSIETSKTELLNTSETESKADAFDEKYLTKIIKALPSKVSLEFPEKGMYEPMTFRSDKQTNGYTTIYRLSPLQI